MNNYLLLLIDSRQMRITQTEKPFSVLEIKIHKKVANDQNDPNLANNCREKPGAKKEEPTGQEKQSKRIMKIRREYLKKIEEIESAHRDQLSILKQKTKEEKRDLTVRYEKELAEKEQYIRVLQEMVSNGNPLIHTKQHKREEESKYVYTENAKHYVPLYEEISDRIDFKIQPRMSEKQFSLDTKGKKKRSMMQSYSNYQCVKSHSSSKHTLRPKSKPSETSQFDGLATHKGLSDTAGYKLTQNSNHRIKGPKPFFI